MSRKAIGLRLDGLSGALAWPLLVVPSTRPLRPPEMATTFVGRRVAPWLHVNKKPLQPGVLLQLVWLLAVKIPLWIVLGVARSPIALTVCSLVVVTFAAYRLAG